MIATAVAATVVAIDAITTTTTTAAAVVAVDAIVTAATAAEKQNDDNNNPQTTTIRSAHESFTSPLMIIISYAITAKVVTFKTLYKGRNGEHQWKREENTTPIIKE